MVNRKPLTAAVIDCRDFLTARKWAETEVVLPPGPKVAFTGGPECNDHRATWDALDRVYPSAGASDHAVLSTWTPVPKGLDLVKAAALPMAIETAHRCLAILDPTPGRTPLVYGAGTIISFAAVQMARLKDVRVVAAAGDTFAGRLRDLGAEVTSYGDGMVERVSGMIDGAPDLIFDAGPASDVLPALVSIVGGDARRVVTVSNHGPAAEALGVRNSFEESWATPRSLSS